MRGFSRLEGTPFEVRLSTWVTETRSEILGQYGRRKFLVRRPSFSRLLGNGYTGR
jgi:hypothetical protein